MTPDDNSSSPVDEQLLAEMMAFDALLHASATEKERGQGSRHDPDEVDDRGRSRLMLLLKMLEANESSKDHGPGPDPAAADRPADGCGPLLGRFDVIDDLGCGGFGFVVRARDRLLGREVALKMPLPERALASGDVHRFLREARAAARLDHPNIVRVFDAGELGPLGYFIASEFCAGPSLRRWLKSQNEPVSPRLAARWMAAIADAIQHAHDRGILHRDIKPDNIILTSPPKPHETASPSPRPEAGADGRARPASPADLLFPRLTDFGLARLAEEAADESGSDIRMGTAHYMAPEQAAGRSDQIGPATDVYALGATLYAIVAGRTPFRGETEAETLRLVLESEPVALRSLRPGLPRDLETICLRCLCKEPSQRYASAGAMRDDLRRFLDGRPIKGRPVSAAERARTWARRRPAIAALVGLVVLLAAGLVGGGVLWASWLGWHARQLEIQIERADLQAPRPRNTGESPRIAAIRPTVTIRPRACGASAGRSTPDNSSWPRTSSTTSGPSRAATTPAASPGDISGGRPTAISRNSGGTRRRSWTWSSLATAGRSPPSTCKARRCSGTFRPRWSWTGRATSRPYPMRVGSSWGSHPIAAT